jgi:predicted enzyme related to lactoylglutathione lyase
MSSKHGDFIWYELITPDTKASQEFYSKVLGWQFEDSGQEGMDYQIVLAPEGGYEEPKHVAGLMGMDPNQLPMGKPMWLGYIGVDDVDQSVAQIEMVGGTVCMPAMDIPNVGRIAMVSDPQGVPFYVMRGASNEKSPAFADDQPRLGHCAWNELMAADQAAAWSFYGDQFSWVKEGEMDMGEQGTYDFIRHDFLLGAIMTAPAGVAPQWSFYFRVAQIDVAVEKVEANGGTVTMGPQEIPGDEFFINGIDPQGAAFCLIGVR